MSLFKSPEIRKCWHVIRRGCGMESRMGGRGEWKGACGDRKTSAQGL